MVRRAAPDRPSRSGSCSPAAPRRQSEIFPVRVRTTSHSIAAAAGKVGAFAGTYALTALLPAIGFGRTSAIVAGVCVLGLLVTVTLLPEPKGLSLEELTEPRANEPSTASVEQGQVPRSLATP